MIEMSIDQYNDMAERLAELEWKLGEREWIPCSERLPEDKYDVLLQFTWNMAVGCICDGEWRINSGDNWSTPVFDDESVPVAWMPLPEPYKGGEDE